MKSITMSINISVKNNSSNNIKKRQTPSGSAMLLVMHVMFT